MEKFGPIKVDAFLSRGSPIGACRLGVLQYLFGCYESLRHAGGGAAVRAAVVADTKMSILGEKAIEATPAAKKAKVKKQPRPKKLSGFDVWKAEALEMAKAQGRDCKALCFSASGMRELTTGWNALPEEEQQLYEDMAGHVKPKTREVQKKLANGTRGDFVQFTFMIIGSVS